MTSPVRSAVAMSLEEFLRLPEEKPCLEYIDGMIEAKVSPKLHHSRIQTELASSLNAYARPSRIGFAVVELRCTFAGRSVLPDVAFLLREHIGQDEHGDMSDEIMRAPDLAVEVVSPGQPPRRPGERLAFALANGCALGWLIDPYRRTIDVYRPDAGPIRLADDGVLEGEPVLPGYRLAVVEVFGWLKIGR